MPSFYDSARTPCSVCRSPAVSTWLKADVEVTRVAEWAGHSVSVLLRIYAKFIDGGEKAALSRVADALRG